MSGKELPGHIVALLQRQNRDGEGRAADSAGITWQGRDLSGEGNPLHTFDGDDGLALGIRVLTVEPSAPVHLTYFRDGAWDPAREVSEMSECSSRASIAANAGFRVYCVVDGGRGGVEIAEWRGQSAPKGNASDFTNYQRVGTVITSV